MHLLLRRLLKTLGYLLAVLAFVLAIATLGATGLWHLFVFYCILWVLTGFSFSKSKVIRKIAKVALRLLPNRKPKDESIRPH